MTVLWERIRLPRWILNYLYSIPKKLNLTIVDGMMQLRKMKVLPYILPLRVTEGKKEAIMKNAFCPPIPGEKNPLHLPTMLIWKILMMKRIYGWEGSQKLM